MATLLAILQQTKDAINLKYVIYIISWLKLFFLYLQ